MEPLLFRLFLVPTAVGSYNDTHTHARSRTRTRKHRSQKEKLEARLLCRGCLAFDSCCGTSKTAAERGKKAFEKRKTFFGFTWAWLALAGRKAIPRLLTRFRDFKRAKHTPRSPAGTHTCAVVYRRPPCVPCTREREERPTGAKENRASVKKNVNILP